MRGFRAVALSVLVLLLAAGSAQAQVTVGAKGGVNFASFSGDDAEDAGTLTGFNGGIFLQIGAGRFVTIQPEAVYSMQGAEFDEDGTSFDLKVNYVQVPVLARVTFAGMGTSVRPHFLLGPYVAFKLGCDFEGDDASVECDADELQAIGIPEVKSTDFGLVFGAGLAFGMTRGEFFVDGRLVQGLTNVFDVEDSDVKNEVWQINAGISLPMGGR